MKKDIKHDEQNKSTEEVSFVDEFAKEAKANPTLKDTKPEVLQVIGKNLEQFMASEFGKLDDNEMMEVMKGLEVIQRNDKLNDLEQFTCILTLLKTNPDKMKEWMKNLCDDVLKIDPNNKDFNSSETIQIKLIGDKFNKSELDKLPKYFKDAVLDKNEHLIDGSFKTH